MSFQPDISSQIKSGNFVPLLKIMRRLNKQRATARVHNVLYKTDISSPVFANNPVLLVPANPNRISLTFGVSADPNGASSSSFWIGYGASFRFGSGAAQGFGIRVSVSNPTVLTSTNFYSIVNGNISLDDVFIIPASAVRNMSVICYEGILAVEANQLAA